MKRFEIVFVIFAVLETVLLLFLAVKYHNLNKLYLQCCEDVSKCDWSKCLIEDEDCVLWGLSEDSVRNMLPTPLWHGTVMIKDDGEWTPPPYERYLSKVKNTRDTITIHSYRWHNPFSNLTNVEVIFEEIDGQWIATSCLEYDPHAVQF